VFKPQRHDLKARTSNDTTASFEDFVRYLLTDAPKDSHWELYNTWCKPCYANYDYIIKFETISQDLAYLKLKLNITNEDHKTLFSAKHTRTNDHMIKEYFDQIPKELALRLYNHYRNDFLLFGYDRPSWLCSDQT